MSEKFAFFIGRLGLVDRFFICLSCWQAELAKAASDHFPELPKVHPELGIFDFWVGSQMSVMFLGFFCPKKHTTQETAEIYKGKLQTKVMTDQYET